MIDRATFIAAVRSLLGTPVVHMGRVAGHGLDCVGVPLAALAACGASVTCQDQYGKLPGEAELRAGLTRYCREIAPGDVIPGDLLQVYAGRQARHLMVLVGHNEAGQRVAVHAWAKGGVVRMVPLGDETRVAAAWRVLGVTDG